jgi:hypothetical protein
MVHALISGNSKKHLCSRCSSLKRRIISGYLSQLSLMIMKRPRLARSTFKIFSNSQLDLRRRR